MIRFVVMSVVGSAVMVLGFSNLQLVELNTPFGEDVKASLAFLLLAAFLGGFLIASAMGIQRAWSTRRRHRQEFQAIVQTSPWLLPPPPQLPAPVYRKPKSRSLRFWRSP